VPACPPPPPPQVHRSEGLIYMVLEYGDIDLARLLQVDRGLIRACCRSTVASSALACTCAAASVVAGGRGRGRCRLARAVEGGGAAG
jgi:hypothetical protein